MVVEGALEGELDDHIGYGKHDPAGRNGGNSRNGHRAKTVLTDTGPLEISVPRDRDASFEPRIVAKRQRRLTGSTNMVISLSAKGLTHGEICATGRRCTARRCPSRRSPRSPPGHNRWTHGQMAEPCTWSMRLVSIDAINVNIGGPGREPARSTLVLGVTVDGERDARAVGRAAW